MADAHEEEILGKAYDSRLMKRLLTYLKPYRWQVVISLLAITIRAAIDVLGPLLTAVAIDKYLAYGTLASKFSSPVLKTNPLFFIRRFLDPWLSPQPLIGVAQISALLMGFVVVGFFLEYAQVYYMQWTGQKVMFDLRAQIFRHLQHMHIAFFDKNPVGRLVTRVTTDVDALNEMFTAGVVAIFEDIEVLIAIGAVLIWMNPRLALITLSVLPLIVWVTMIFRKYARDSYRRTRTAIARINSFLQEHVSGMVVLQLFNREKVAYQRFEAVNQKNTAAWKDAIMAYAIYYPVVEILSSTAIACVIWFGARWYGGAAAVVGMTTLGILTAYIQYAQRFFRPIQDLSDKYNILQAAMASAERIFKLLDTPAEITQPAQPKIADGPGRIEFDHVWFAYRNVPQPDPKQAPAKNGDGIHIHDSKPGEPDWVLCDVSFTIEPGETVAIVGHTGAGKTTILSLLLRFYDVQGGAIRIDGVDIREMDLTALRRRFGMVLQDPFLFSGTIEQNIRLGTSDITDEAIERAATEVNVADFIRTLPNQFKEEVRERGSTLSTGQKQLISFARALAHDPKILILDEATSSVDTETEFRVRDALSRMIGAEGRTSIVVAHRLSTIQRSDKIIVMHKARVREMGSHQQLLAQRGIYWKLYQLQYKDQEIPA